MKKARITVSGIQVEVWWKAVKKINLVVYASDGRVRISVPSTASLQLVQQTVAERVGWIKKQQAKFRARISSMPLQFIEGEYHSFLGKKYPLSIGMPGRRHFVTFDRVSGITLHLRRGNTLQHRKRLLETWYREQLQKRIPPLLYYWQPRVGEKVYEIRIKRMKTRWGTCNITKRRIWLNLELIKKPEKCLEYIIVHEMIHLLEPCHNSNFYNHLERLLPGWRSIDSLLGQGE